MKRLGQLITLKNVCAIHNVIKYMLRNSFIRLHYFMSEILRNSRNLTCLDPLTLPQASQMINVYGMYEYRLPSFPLIEYDI